MGISLRQTSPNHHRLLAHQEQQRHVAVAPVVAVEEAPLLLPVEGNVGRVQIEDHFFGLLLEAFDAQRDQQLGHLAEVRDDLAGPGVVEASGGEFEPAEGGSARARGAVPAAGGHAARDRLEGGVATQFVVVVQVLVPEGESAGALEKQRLDVVDDQLGFANDG